MKKNIITAVTLMTICIICAAAISGINLVTEPIIEQNKIEKEKKLCKKIFVDFDEAKETIDSGFDHEEIVKLVVAEDNSDSVLGYIYTVSGKNTYGIITLLVGINTDKELVSVQFMENGQTVPEIVPHVENNYVGGVTAGDVESIDTSCGATYAADLVKELVKAAFADLETREVA